MGQFRQWKASPGVPWWCSGLKIRNCHRCDGGSAPGTGTSSAKKKKKKKQSGAKTGVPTVRRAWKQTQHVRWWFPRPPSSPSLAVSDRLGLRVLQRASAIWVPGFPAGRTALCVFGDQPSWADWRRTAWPLQRKTTQGRVPPPSRPGARLVSLSTVRPVHVMPEHALVQRVYSVIS